jgi:hypothetical protein
MGLGAANVQVARRNGPYSFGMPHDDPPSDAAPAFGEAAAHTPPLDRQPIVSEPSDQSFDAHPFGAEDTQPPRRRRLRGWLIGTAVAVVAIGAGVAVHFWALDTFAKAGEEFDAAASEASTSREALDDTAGDAMFTSIAAGRIEKAASGDGLADAASVEGFGAALKAYDGALDDANTALDTPLPDAVAQPAWTWELFAASDRLRADTADAEAQGNDAVALGEALAAVGDDLDQAATALYESVAPRAAEREKANISAKTGAVLDHREAAAELADDPGINSYAAGSFEALVHSAKILVQSNGEELAEKQGPLLNTRLEIEEYARSISGGVVLDFDYADIVAGIGGSAGMGGTATWATDRGGYSTITLSHSLVENWPSADARALVTHEVGHAITSKCYEKFDWESQDANEEWATAWAISMGHTAEGNGVQAYGYPSQQMIDVAATCR